MGGDDCMDTGGDEWIDIGGEECTEICGDVFNHPNVAFDGAKKASCHGDIRSGTFSSASSATGSASGKS